MPRGGRLMCGGCGVAHTDPVTAVLRGAYPRLVVARLLSDVHPAVQATAGPTGWSVTCRGRPVRLAATLDEVAEVAADGFARCGVSAAEVDAARRRQPPHRAVPGQVSVPEPTQWIYDVVVARVMQALDTATHSRLPGGDSAPDVPPPEPGEPDREQDGGEPGLREQRHGVERATRQVRHVPER